jgi:mannose-6-phosphate isomerase-like protein (cupin superfamily)
MKRYTMEEGLASGLDVLGGTERSQAATLELAPYTKTENRHDGSDRWVYVLTGSGKAVVGGLDVKLAPGTLVLVEAGEPHELDNTGGEPMVLLNVYSPPPR